MLNNNEFADLHLHSNHSDGYFSPTELIDKSLSHGFKAISIVDHDDIGALTEATSYGHKHGIEVIAGVELSVNFLHYDLHLLAYCFDHQNTELVNYLEFFKEERIKRAKKIVELLCKLGMPISFDAVLEIAGPGSVGRPHIANLLVTEGYAHSFQDAFNRFLGDGRPANVGKYKIDLKSAFTLVKQAGGVCSIAHPGLLLKNEDVVILIKAGVNCIEVIHPKHNHEQTRYYSELAKNYSLVATGGSDFHGGRRGDEVLGKFKIPYESVLKMKELVK